MFATLSVVLLVNAATADAAIDTSDMKRGLGLCAAEEVVFFDCAAKGRKRLSVCASSDLKKLQYRFGKPGKIELAYPRDSDPRKLKYGYEAWARGEESSLSFERDGFTYRVVIASGSGIDGPSNNYAGVKVLKVGDEKAFVRCVSDPESRLESLEKLGGL